MNKRRSTVAFYVVCTLAIAFSGPLFAGDLDPPPGPVAPTHKTLTEVEPRTAINATNTPGDPDSSFRISQPGSYYLTGNVTGETGKHGIEIASSQVVIDLCGFELTGVAGALDGITANSALVNVSLRNGFVTAWPQDGIDLSSVRGGNVINVVADQNSGVGIDVSDSFVIKNCVATDNLIGIAVSRSSTIVACVANYNLSHGMQVSLGGGASVITASLANSNGAIGIFVVQSSVTKCAAHNNGTTGIRALEGSAVAESAANYNILDGISSEYSSITNCSTMFNSRNGINADNCLVHSNSSVFNSTSNISSVDSTLLENHAPP